MAPHFVLFEHAAGHAAGYGLFKVKKKFEEVAPFLFFFQVKEALMDVSKFQQVSSIEYLSSFVFKHTKPK